MRCSLTSNPCSIHHTTQQALGPLLDALDEASTTTMMTRAAAATQAGEEEQQAPQEEAAAEGPTPSENDASHSSRGGQPPHHDDDDAPLPSPTVEEREEEEECSGLALALTRLKDLASAPSYLQRQLFVHAALAIPDTAQRPTVAARYREELLPLLVSLAFDGKGGRRRRHACRE